jgi:hypothetical protein
MTTVRQIIPTDGDHSTQQSKFDVRKSIEIIIWSALAIFFIAPLFLINYYQDDRVFSLMAEFSHITPFEGAVGEIKSWLSSGRFLPFSVFVRHLFFDTFSYQNAWLYHLVILILSGGAFYIFLKLIQYYKFNGSAVLFFLFFMALTQFRVTAPDSIIGYNALVQINTIFVCAALIYIEMFFQRKEIRHFIFGVIFSIVSVLYYEISVVILAAPIFVYLYKYQFRTFQKQFALYALFYITLLLTFIVLRIYLKKSFAVPDMGSYAGTELGFDFKSVLSAFVFQVSGSLPMSYIAHLFERLFHTYIVSFAIIGLACIFIYVKRAQIALLDRKFLFFGLFIIFSAALPVALSKHHSSWVSLGYPYIPVFMQNLALASILAALVSNKRMVRALLFFIIFISSIPNYVLFHELNKKDGPIRLTVDILGLQNYQLQTKFDRTFITVDGNREGKHEIELGFLQNIAKPEFGEIFYTNPSKPVFEKGTVSNVILLSKSNYGNTIAVMGRVEEGSKINSPVYLSSNRACIEQIASDKGSIVSYKTHRETMIYGYSVDGYYNLEDKLSCKLNNNWYNDLMDKFVPRQ